jgi:preprotein translocase subunit YajC
MNEPSAVPSLGFASPPPADPNAPQPSPFSFFVPMILMFVIFYFVLIRPQQKAKKEQDQLISGVKTGDRITTTGGILGTVANVKDKTVIVRVADNVKVELLKTHIATVSKDTETNASS